jgi:hypothetical protein
MVVVHGKDQKDTLFLCELIGKYGIMRKYFRQESTLPVIFGDGNIEWIGKLLLNSC